MRGIPVASVLADGLRDVAFATLAPNGAPIILYNPSVRRMNWQTQLFFYAHECGHHALGHPLEGPRLGQEQQADCWGINAIIYRARLVSDADVSVIQRDLYVFGRGDWTHLPGPVRAINLRKCLGNKVTGNDDSSTRVDTEEERSSGTRSVPGNSSDLPSWADGTWRSETEEQNSRVQLRGRSCKVSVVKYAILDINRGNGKSSFVYFMIQDQDDVNDDFCLDHAGEIERHLDCTFDLSVASSSGGGGVSFRGRAGSDEGCTSVSTISTTVSRSGASDVSVSIRGDIRDTIRLTLVE